MAKLSPIQVREMLSKAAEGLSSDGIAAWFKAEHGIKISGQAIRQRLRETREERGEVAAAVTKEALTKVVTSDLDVLSTSIHRTQELEERLFTIATQSESKAVIVQEAAEACFKATATLKGLVDLRLHYAGADSGEGVSGGVELPADPGERLSVLRALTEREERKAGR